MEFAKILKHRREELGLGVRETARLTDRPHVPAPIKSPVYISRLENKVVEEMKAESISIDKLWALGVALRVSPLVFFAQSRSMFDPIDQIPQFGIREAPTPVTLSQFLRDRRKELSLTLQQVEEMSRRVSPWSISSAYLCEVETDADGASERISAEKLWAIARVYDTDPLLLYVLSRKVDPRYLSSASRDRLFS